MKQSPNDHKRYRTLTLTNGLRVLLIQNDDTAKAAVALAVNAGHFDDPKPRQGLAHFVEHMLFLGTEKYPDGNEYQHFINQHGGHNNAWTATEHTCFFFDINHKYLPEALDRFSQFFISPLLSKEFVESERQNIDAEFKLKLKDDLRRLYDVHKETVNPEHPFSQFSVGNIETLADKVNAPVQQDIVTFFNQHYLANAMTLVVEGPQNLDALSELTQHYFSAIKAGGINKKVIKTPLYTQEHLAQEIHVSPVKNDRQLIISFALPSTESYYRHKPDALLAYLIGHEGAGSILSLLKKKQWALGLTAGSGINGSNFKDFNISISLTEHGEQNTDKIISIVFSYIALLQKAPLPQHYYFEKQSLANIAFQFLEKAKPLDAVCHLAMNMHHYPADDYIYGDYVMESMCEQSITHLLTLFNINNCRIIRIGQHFTCDKTSQWYQVPYSIKAIDAQRKQVWCAPVNQDDLFLPPKNDYITQHPTIWPHSHDSAKPALLESQNGLCIWYKQDTTFKVPKGYLYLGIDSPLAVSSVSNIAMTRLFVDLYSEAVIEKYYDAELAGIHYQLYSHQGGMTLQLSGLSENQPLLLEKLLSELTQPNITEAQFKLIKHHLISHWKNADKSKSISQLFSALSSLMQPNNPTTQSLITALEVITFEQFTTFIKQLFEHVTINALIHGNWLESHAQKITGMIKDAFSHHFDGRNHVNCPVIDINNEDEFIVPIHMPNHDHAVLIYYPFADKSLKTTALAMLTSHLLSPIFFQEMRTEKQFGYLVNVGYIPINRYPGTGFYIQSPHATPCELVLEIDAFIESAAEKIKTMPTDKWYTFINGLSAQLKEKDTSLRTKSQRFWSCICNQDFDFSQKESLIHIINKITLADIIQFIRAVLVKKDNDIYQDRLTLISTVSTDQTLDKLNNKHYTVIESPIDFTSASKRKY